MKALSIVESKDTPFITIYMKHNSPDIAKKWIDIVIYNINESMREDDRKNAENAINYLNNIGDSIKIQSLKEVRSSLLESQMQILMLAASNNAYVFKILEAPISPEIKSSPNRAIICILGTLFGGLLSALIIIFNYFLKENLNNNFK